MSKLKFLNLFLAPLCLKIRGRIVGAFSKITMAIYIGFGLFMVVSILVMIVFANLQPNSDVVVRPEAKESKSVEEQSAVNTILPKNVPEVAVVVAKEKESQQQQTKEIVTVPRFIKGAIQLEFGWQKHPVYNDWRYHTGIDIKGTRGQSVQAVYKGQVTDIFRDRHSGLTLVVTDATYSIYYGSLAEVTVDKGSFVSANQVIGKMGSCDAEPEDHLHLAIKKGEKYIDPQVIIPKE